METLRKPFQGVTNIIRFNWHFYLLTAILIIIILAGNYFLSCRYRIYAVVLCILIVGAILISLLSSFYIYDLSDLYSLHWLDKLNINPKGRVVNINAGFDETSELLSLKYPVAELCVLDFYDPKKHTEVSIKRARAAYPPYKNTQQISTDALPLEDKSTDTILVIFAAHEIRNNEERIYFFKELHRTLKDGGKIIITEHIRNLQNFLVYNIGFFHFLSRASWLATFQKSGLGICEEIKITPFITTFILTKNGTAS